MIDDKSHAAAMSEENFGEFFNGRSYIILFSYSEKEQVKSVAFFWAGSRSSPADYIAYQTGLYEQLEEKMEAEGGKAPLQMRFQQFTENEFFLSLFEGVMIIHNGNDPDGERPEKSLYCCKGNSPADSRAVQLDRISASDLCSLASFVLLTPSNVYKW